MHWRRPKERASDGVHPVTFLWRMLVLGASLALAGCPSGPSRADHGVVLVYHHVSGDTPAATSVTPERFDAHLAYLEANDFRIWPLERLLDATIGGEEPVPDNTVAITFDDAYESVYTEAWPRLRERGWPFAVLANTDAIDAGHSPYMSWSQLRDLHEAGVTIGNHSASHEHLIARHDGESESAWEDRVDRDISRADRRLSEEIGEKAGLFAYPFGESSRALADIVADYADYALAQRSGAVGPGTDPLSIPRFPMASGFDGMDRFALAVDSRPLPVTAVEPDPPGDGVRPAVESLQLTIAEGAYGAAQLACFASSGERLSIDREAGPPHHVTIDVDSRGRTGRNKVNCTAPASDGSGDYFWYAFQWVQDAVRD